MAEVSLSVEKLAPTGLAATYTGSLSTDNTYKVRNSGRMFLHFKKSGAGDCVATIQTPKTVGGLAVSEQAVTVPATSGDMMIGPFPPGIYNDTNQDVNFTLDEVTGLTVACVEL